MTYFTIKISSVS